MPTKITLATTALVLLAAGPAAARTPATPIKQDGTTALPAFRGAPATARPITGIPKTPQNPFMARNMDSGVHNDAWQTDAYTRSGPLGRSPSVFSADLGGRVCITLTFDSKGRIVASCISLAEGPRLFMLDPSNLDTLASLQLPFRPPPAGISPLTNTTGGAYFYLDNKDRAVIATTDRHIWIVGETGGTANPGFKRVKDFNVSGLLRPDERLPSAVPDWKGRIWFVGRQKGTVGVIDPKTGKGKSIHLNEEIENSFATSPEGVYIATDKSMYRFNLTKRGVPKVTWKSKYDNVGIQKPGQFDAGTGTTPTVMHGGYVAITDNADPMQVVVYRTAAKLKRGQKRVVCEQPVFGKGAGDTENSLLAAGRSLIVENNYGYILGGTSPANLSTAGFARVDVNANGRGCKLVWTNTTEHAPSVVPKISLKTGLIYTFTEEQDPANPTTDVWAWTALDYRTGVTSWKRIAGLGTAYNNHYAGIAVGQDGKSAFLGGVSGVMAIRDS
jgi:hypothetical protein